MFFRWRPNLRDEADNHLVDLAIAGGARAIVTWNVRDFAGGEIRLQSVRVLTPGQVMAEIGE